MVFVFFFFGGRRGLECGCGSDVDDLSVLGEVCSRWTLMVVLESCKAIVEIVVERLNKREEEVKAFVTTMKYNGGENVLLFESQVRHI